MEPLRTKHVKKNESSKLKTLLAFKIIHSSGCRLNTKMLNRISSIGIGIENG